MDGARLKQRLFVNDSQKILVTFWHMCEKVAQLKGKLSRRFKCFQAHTHAQREVSHALFSRLKQFGKICLENTLVSCMTQSFSLFIQL